MNNINKLKACMNCRYFRENKCTLLNKQIYPEELTKENECGKFIKRAYDYIA